MAITLVSVEPGLTGVDVVVEAPTFNELNTRAAQDMAVSAASGKLASPRIEKTAAPYPVNDKGEVVRPGDGQAAASFRRKFRLRGPL